MYFSEDKKVKKIVVFGGGTGLSCVLSGLKLFPLDVTTVIAVSDNGSSTGSWEATYGPLKKGFTTYLKFVNQSTYDLNQCHARIYVSREKEPFVIKAEESGVNSLNLSYQIDF